MKKQLKSPIVRYSTGDIISIYVYGEILDPSNYIEELETIRNARDTDTLMLYFNTPGGDMDTAISFISAMAYTNANIVGIIDGVCASAGSLIFLAANEFEISRGASMLIHTYSSWLGGKRNEILSQVAFSSSLYENLFKDIYLGFLTEDEISRVNSGHDMWLSAEEIGGRCSKLLEYRMSKNDEVSEEGLSDTECSKD